MTSTPPEYFLRVQEEAKGQWDKLEADPALAGPWRQLFRQVQSPRHVLSELLQNADDAGATRAHAKIAKNVFEFSHNGEDFNEDSLRSLCRFGFSNKRHLHTIGFRGVGFKSTFSLGPRVEVHTPTLGFAFHHLRFTEPEWISNYQPVNETVIKVAFDKESKEKALFTEFGRWLDTPHPLLFFENILRLKIQSRLIYKEILGPGPTPNSEKIWLANPHKQEVLCFRSEPADFPLEALEEIREERGSQDFEVPAFTVQIVLGGAADQQLFTVLPTEVRLKIPFAVNGPFIQDPSRKEIKHPSNSPTNTLLLQKLGRLAGEALEEWLNNTNLELSERALAYELIPVPISSDSSLGDESTRILVEELKKHLSAHKRLLLGHDGSLVKSEDAVSFPEEVLDTWEPDQALEIFAPDKKKIFFKGTNIDAVKTLEKWNLLEILDERDIGNRLLSHGKPGPPRPQPLEKLLHLWNLLNHLTSDWTFRRSIRQLPVVPVGKREEMLSAEDVLVVGGKESRVSSKDWTFLMQRADIVEPDWIELLSRSETDGHEEDAIESYKETNIPTAELSNSVDLLSLMKLQRKVGLEKVISSVSKRVFQHEDPGSPGVQIAHIAARGAASIPDEFQFLCRDGRWRSVKNELIVEENNNLLALAPDQWIESKVISSDYRKDLSEEDIEIWDGWVRDRNKSKLLRFPLPKDKRVNSWGKSEIEEFCRKRGGTPPGSYQLKTPDFGIQDFDWDKALWSHWEICANEDENFWSVIAFSVLKNWSKPWKDRIHAVVKQWGTTREYLVESGQLRAEWLERLRSLPCIPDIFGQPSIPAQLCRSTADTRPLHNVEKFVHSDFDKPEYEEILDLLGVRREAKHVKPLLDRLRALSRADRPPITGIVDIYRAVDQVILRMAPENAESLKNTFAVESLTYTDDGAWEQIKNVFKDNPDDIPGIRVIHPEARNLAIWDRLQVVERPTLEMAVLWLKGIARGEPLLKSERIRAIQIMRRAPSTVWNECGAWIDTSGRWTETRDLKWGATEPTMKHDLFASTQRRVANFSILGDSASEFSTKVGLNRLESALEQRIQNYSPAAGSANPPWVQTLGKTLARLRIRENDSDLKEKKATIDADRIMGARLANSNWQPVLHLTMVPYLEGQPCGSERVCKVAWQDDTIFVVGQAPSNHRELAHEISRHFLTSEAREAVKDCIDRDSTWIAVYAREHLELENTQYQPEIPIDGGEESGESGPREFGGQAETGTQPVSEEDKEFEAIVRLRKKRQEGKKQAFIQFMKNQGFEWSEARSCLVHTDGTVIVKTPSPFHWSASQNGTQKTLFWLGRGSIEEGIEIPSEVWNWPSINKSEVYLFLMDKNDTSVILSMTHLKERAKVGDVDLFSSKYFVRASGN